MKPVDLQLAQGGRFIRNQAALVALGKALFWDQQVGSDGQACASCHFSAGADPRTKNQVSPGLNRNPPDTGFEIGTAPNHQLVNSDFPVLADDVVSSAGVFFRTFSSIQANPAGLAAPRPPFDAQAMDNCVSSADPAGFQVGPDGFKVNVRRVEPRNTPTMINAMFNNRNFWDSRAQDVFNGVNPFGARDPNPLVWEDTHGPNSAAAGVSVAITFSSLASQAVGPPLSKFEMSCFGRTFPDVGHKLLTATTTPLAQQDVSARDSVLGPISNANIGRGSKGLFAPYTALVQAAFDKRWWQSTQPVGSRPQIEANFSLFFGLAVGAYMETLRADDSLMDRFFDGSAGLTESQLRGLKLFESACATFDTTTGQCLKAQRPDPPRNPTTRVDSFLIDGTTPADLRCTTCHGGPEITGASIDAVRNDARLERMTMVAGARPTPPACAIYDAGHFNTGVRPTSDDPGLGGSDDFSHPFGETQLAILGQLQQFVPTAVPPFGLAPALGGTTNCDSANVNGTFKAPQLRNVELTGPYFHNGGKLTLAQVVDFYNRGGDFAGENATEFDPNVHSLNLGPQDKTDLVAFLMALTDERVAFERAPFDHPSICAADGQVGSETSVTVGQPLPGGGSTARAADNVLCVGAVGAGGRATRLRPFLNVSQ